MSSEMPIAVDNGRVKPGVLEGSNRGSWRGQTGVLGGVKPGFLEGSSWGSYGRLKPGFLWKDQAGVLVEGSSRGSRNGQMLGESAAQVSVTVHWKFLKGVATSS